MSNWKNKLLNAGYVKPVFTTVSVTGYDNSEEYSTILAVPNLY